MKHFINLCHSYDRVLKVGLFTDWEIDVQVSMGLMLFVVSIPPSQMGEVEGLLGEYSAATRLTV